MAENSFVSGTKKATPTDVKLAGCYYPLLCEIVRGQKEITFKKFIQLAKARYPDVEEVQKAWALSTGRRLEFIRTYTRRHQLPDLSAWVVNEKGEYGEDYLANFDPDKEREASKLVNWDDYKGDWDEYLQELTKATIKVKRIKEKDARALMGQHFLKVKDSIPNPKKLPLVEVTKHFRDGILEGLMEGKLPEAAFNDVIFDMNSRSA